LRIDEKVFDGFVKSPPVALRFVVAEGRGGSPSRRYRATRRVAPPLGFARLDCKGERRSPGQGRSPDAPTIETIIWVNFYEITILGEEETGGKEWIFS